MIIKKNYGLINKAIELINNKANCKIKLASFITKGRYKIIFKGYNDNSRTLCNNRLNCCLHA